MALYYEKIHQPLVHVMSNCECSLIEISFEIHAHLAKQSWVQKPIQGLLTTVAISVSIVDSCVF